MYICITDIFLCTLRAGTLANVSKALVDGGFLMIFEITNMMPALLWGLDKRCWQCSDERAYGQWTTIEQWEGLLLAGGFEKARQDRHRMSAAAGTHMQAQQATATQQSCPAAELNTEFRHVSEEC